MRLRPLAIVFSLALLAALGGCTSDNRSGTFLVGPGKFTLYNCAELAQHQKSIVVRQRDLEGLMAKAGQSSAGRMVSGMAYQADYQTILGEMKVLRQEAAAKNCNLPDPYAAPAPPPAPPPAAGKPAKPKR